MSKRRTLAKRNGSKWSSKSVYVEGVNVSSFETEYIFCSAKIHCFVCDRIIIVSNNFLILISIHSDLGHDFSTMGRYRYRLWCQTSHFDLRLKRVVTHTVTSDFCQESVITGHLNNARWITEPVSLDCGVCFFLFWTMTCDCFFLSKENQSC